MVINDPKVVEEITAEFAAYDRALGDNDVAALNRFFFDSPFTIRYGNAENLYGYSEIRAYRGTVVRLARSRHRELTGVDTATRYTIGEEWARRPGQMIQP